MGAIMQDVLEFLDDLKELQKLYAMGDICYMDFQEKINKYEQRADKIERDMEDLFDNMPV
jgi:uncharacterized protein with von Willebrand factor type A (vWA) domain